MWRGLGVLAIIVGAVLLPGGGHATDCANWSSKFDGIKNPEVRAEFRSRSDRRSWDQLIEEAGGPAKALVLFRNDLRDARSRLDNANGAAEALKAAGTTDREITWQECSGQTNARTAARCEALNMREMIMALEGSIELVQCRMGR